MIYVHKHDDNVETYHSIYHINQKYSNKYHPYILIKYDYSNCSTLQAELGKEISSE